MRQQSAEAKAMAEFTEILENSKQFSKKINEISEFLWIVLHFLPAPYPLGEAKWSGGARTRKGVGEREQHRQKDFILS